mgnify:CR=1 FL=1|tara:strand:+ start:319 stop:528 length:210 start_codon:yes stop_codon:yes gene_type:complete
MKKYKVDEWVTYRPFPDDESRVLSEIQKKSLILYVLPNDEYYDYKIFIADTGKIKKVREHQLFPVSQPT